MCTLCRLESCGILLLLIFNLVDELFLSEISIEVPHGIVDVPVARLANGTHELSHYFDELILIEQDIFCL